MAWTAPTTVAPNDVITSALWNSDVRDNSLYLKNAVTFVIEQAHNNDEDSSTSSDSADAQGSITITTTVTSHIIVFATFNNRIAGSGESMMINLTKSDNTDIASTNFSAKSSDSDQRDGGSLMGIVEDAAAGAYTYKLRFKRVSGAATVYIDEKKWIAIAIPVVS